MKQFLPATAFVLALLIANGASAREHNHAPHRHHSHHVHVQKHKVQKHHVQKHVVAHAARPSGELLGGRPSGCPRQYCGCALANFLGLHDVRLNLADAWKRLFPRTEPHPGAVAVRKVHYHGYGHVALLVEHISGSNWLVRDFNSTRGLSWLHQRNMGGFIFVAAK